jgi:hypothetical protein
MSKVTEINKEALEPVLVARDKAVELAQAADRAMKEARLAELEFKVQIQQLYLEKGLDSNCRVDITTGVVTWPEEQAEAKEEAPKKKRTAKKKASKKAEPKTEEASA